MLDRVTLRTKFVALIAVALVALGAVGMPRVLDLGKQRSAAHLSRDRVRVATTLGVLLNALDHEATLTAWFNASGLPTVRGEMAAARPLTDRAARSISSPTSIRSLPRSVRRSVHAVAAQWKVLRTARVRFDRRLASDDRVLVQFDRPALRVVEALRAIAAAPSGLAGTDASDDPTVALYERARIAEIERDAAASQAAVMTAVVRHEVSPTLARRLGAVADRQRATGTTWDPTATASGGGPRWREFQAFTRRTSAYRAPAIVGRLPFVTATEWRRVSDLEIDAIGRLGRITDRAGTASAARAAERARWATIRTGLAFAVAGLVIIGAVGLVARSVGRMMRAQRTVGNSPQPAPASEIIKPAIVPAPAIRSVGDDQPSNGTDTDSPADPIAVAPPLPRRKREHCGPEPGVPLSVPARRGPDAAFELVARYEAGLRRARTSSDRGHAPGDSP